MDNANNNFIIAKLAEYKHIITNFYINLITGQYYQIYLDIHTHILNNKYTYILLSILICSIIYLESMPAKRHQRGGTSNNNPLTQSMRNARDLKKEVKTELKQERAREQIIASQSGLCSGSGVLAGICHGIKSGFTGLFTALSIIVFILLGISAPFVIYMALLYMVLKLMIMGTVLT